MSWFEVGAIILAGVWAGTINTVVGSGTLVTFPTLLSFGYPPVSANISNSLGLVAGGASGAWGYRHEIRSLRTLLVQLAPASFVGAVIGALLLLVLPPEAFEAIVPVLILLALVLVVLGPRLNAWAARQHAEQVTGPRFVVLIVGILLAGMYGGYFGAAQGVLLIGLMSVLLPNGLQELNGVKNVLGLIVNFTAAVVFLIVDPAQVNWAVVGLIAIGSFIGGVLGARIGRSMPPWLLRLTIVVIGVVAIVVLLV
ncbi:sulfite exporter TauE/SafE family protein [Ornithinimicrobium sp. F0845]|uniref:sulfite exporter TauE/SafE family protein n=1 Tax=Ornithinimicrobium sp. F0845 TaxID=2926412 RepID=UPI001FF3C7ED|nr:sulfite exporter TauE/SafE family protein [Ornithinimicrobium sp. F0845]MCK0113750.1 sulfite exporter TauE/SafE family protein [Ornithinimicrobium sp. F0845]